MIQPTAPTLATGLVQTAGMASNAGPGASAGASAGAENPSFAALLEGGTTAAAPLVAPLDTAPTTSLPSAVFATGKPLDPLIAALRAGNAESQSGKDGKDGNAGKAIGKNLPSMPDDAGSITDLSQAPGEAVTDILGVPIGLVGILALPGALPPSQTPPANSAPIAAATTATPAAATASTSQGLAAAAPIEALLARRTALSNRTPAPASPPVAPLAESARGTAAIAPASPALPTNASIGAPTVTFTAIEIVPAGDPRIAPPATAPASGPVPALPEVATTAGVKADATSEVPATKAKKADKLSATLLGEARPFAPEATPPAIGADIAAARAATVSITTTAASTAPATAEGPQDFAALVGRLAEAREAADPQLVRTSLAHGEFGRVSLQFRHEDAGMAVTMASADPDFTRSVQAAAAASLAGGNAGPGDQPRGDAPQGQTSTQQQGQAAAQAGAGNNNGAGGQSQQDRAEQAGRNVQREAGAASRAQDPDASSPRQSRDGTRPGGGVYA